MATQTTEREPRRTFIGPLSDTIWRTGVAHAYGRIDEQVAEALAGVPRQPSGEHSVLADRGALAKVAAREVAECVAYARRNGMSWTWVGEQLGSTPTAAERRYAKLPRPPYVMRADHGAACGELPQERLTDDWKGWGCACGAAGRLDRGQR